MTKSRFDAMTAAAISGTFVTYKHVPTRGVVQLVVEIEIEAQAAAFEALGYPEPGKSIHVAVARLNALSDPSDGRVEDRASVPQRLGDVDRLCDRRGGERPPPIAEGHEAASGDAAAPTSPVVPEGGENRGARYHPGYDCDTSGPGESCTLCTFILEARIEESEPSVTNICDYCGETGHSAGKCPKARYAAMDDMAKARVRANLLAKDMRFHAWIGIEGAYESCVAVAANSIRRDIGVKSRSEIATNYGTYLRFLALENRYRIAVGLAPEPRE